MAKKQLDEKTQPPVTLKINGQSVTARPGQTVLEVVREQGLDDIPSLCYDPKLEPFGSCFVCVVEVKGMRGLVPSCTTRVKDGMEVTTRNEKIIKARKSALELLMSDHYAECVCPAQRGCPAGVDVQGYLGLARLGHYGEAIALIRRRNPLPLICSKICVRKCEVNCRRKDVDDPVGINFVKRYCAEHADFEAIRIEKKPPTGKRVAVVGGGPAGLTCAYYLALEGHEVKILESMPKLGGMLRYGIPEYRLPKAELDKEINEIIRLGIEVSFNQKLGKDFSVEGLLKGTGKFDAVFLSLGAPLGSKLGVPGEDAEGVESGLDFLRDTQHQGLRKLHGKVVVVGGGNSALDAARTALRSGADEVTILYRRTRAEMPAHHEEVDAAEAEGIRLEILAAPTEVIAENGRLKALRCIRMELGEPDDSGRRRPVPIKGSEFDYPCDFVFAAIGQETDKSVFSGEKEDSKPKVSRRGTITVDETTMATNLPGVFAGGDVITGPAVVIDAIAHGHTAADTINEYLKTGQVKKSESLFVSKRELFGPIPERMYEDVKRVPRHHIHEREPQIRRRDFKEVEIGLSKEEMEEEAIRCMECGCRAQYRCDLRRYTTEYNVDVMRHSGQVRRHKVDDSHPLITIDPNKCILCGRCIRTCADVLGQPMLGFVGRGFTTVVKPALGKPLQESPCISCGACLETCPTGALTAKLPYGRQGPWEAKHITSVCTFCSVACPLDLNVVTDGLVWATSITPDGVNGGAGSQLRPGEGDLCFKGRFGTALVQSAERLSKPLVRKDGVLKEASWDEAIKEAAKFLKGIRDTKGPDALAVLAAPRMTLEESYLVGRLARAALGTDQVASFARGPGGKPRRDLDDILGETASTCFREDIDSADVALVAGADPSVNHPVISMAVRRAARNGARVVTINSNKVDLVRTSELWLDPRRGTAGFMLAGVLRQLLDRGDIKWDIQKGGNGDLSALKDSIAKATPEEIAQVAGVSAGKVQDLANMLATAKNVVAIYDLDDTLERANDDLLILAQIMMLTGHIAEPGSGLLLLQADCNSEGARLAGMMEGDLPGGYPLDNAEMRRKVAQLWNADMEGLTKKGREGLWGNLSAGRISGALVMFEDFSADAELNKLLGNLEAMVVIDHFLTETGKAAQVALPAATLVESEGTVVSFDRRLRAVAKASPPVGGMSNAEIICGLSEALGHPIPSADTDSIRWELESLLGISAETLAKARQEAGAWPLSRRFPTFKHLRKVDLSEKAMFPARYPYATLDRYIYRRLCQLGLFT